MVRAKNSVVRRTLMGLGIAGAAAAVLNRPARAQAPATRWQPTSEPQDGWLENGGRHRLVFDTVSMEGLGKALVFANNFFVANKSGYGLEPTDLAVIIILRNMSTAFGYTDAIWAKYGPALSERLVLTDPRTKTAPLVNLYQLAGKDSGSNNAVTLDTLAKLGVRLAVCATATHGIASMIAAKTGGTPEAIFAELTGNLVRNGLMVPAGIVALNRAQEHGYAFSYAG
jgi:hypothetical protein